MDILHLYATLTIVELRFFPEKNKNARISSNKSKIKKNENKTCLRNEDNP